MDTKKKAYVAVLIGNSIFGFSFLFSKIALEITSPEVMVATRFVVAFVVMNGMVLVGRAIKRKDGSGILPFSLKGKPKKYILLLAIFQPVIYFLSESYGIAYTSSSFAGTIIAVIPLMGIVLDIFIMKTKVSVKQMVCAATSVLGVGITTMGSANLESSILGVCMLFIAVLSGSLFYVFSKKAGEHYNPFERTYVMFAVGSAVFTVIALVKHAGEYGRWIGATYANPSFWWCMLYLAVCSSVIAFMILNYASSHITISEASIFANLTTVISIVAGVVILNESFTVAQIMGAIVIVGSVYISNK